MSNLTRRSILLAGSGVLVALAGCSGGGDSNGGSEATTAASTPDQPTALAVENAVLCAEQPTGYQQYTEQPGATYQPGDVIWVYFEPSTVGTESAGEGEIEFEFDFTISVSDPNGQNLGTVTDTAGRTFGEGVDLSTVFLAASYSPPMEFEPGPHTLEIEVTDTIAGNTATESIEFEVEGGVQKAEGEFGMNHFVFTEQEASGYRGYTENTAAEFRPSETVWYYYEIDGFSYEYSEGAYVHNLHLSKILRGPQGAIWLETDPVPLPQSFESPEDVEEFYYPGGVTPNEEWEPGEYEFQYELTDGYTDETVTETYTYSVVE